MNKGFKEEKCWCKFQNGGARDALEKVKRILGFFIIILFYFTYISLFVSLRGQLHG